MIPDPKNKQSTGEAFISQALVFTDPPPVVMLVMPLIKDSKYV